MRLGTYKLTNVPFFPFSLLYVPIAFGLSIFGWAYLSITLAVVLFLLLLNWQLARRLDDRVKGLGVVQEKQATGRAVRRIAVAIGYPIVFVALALPALSSMLDYLGGPFFVAGLLRFQIGWGHISMEVGRIIVVIVALLATSSAVGVVNEAIAIRQEKRAGKDKGSIQALQTLSGYIIWFLFGMGALYLIGFTMGNIAVITGGLSVGVGFGLQNIIQNFVGGLILLFSRPIQPGDLLDHGGKFCRVRKVSILMAGSELRYRIREVFKEKGIEIAYPQIDVHLAG